MIFLPGQICSSPYLFYLNDLNLNLPVSHTRNLDVIPESSLLIISHTRATNKSYHFFVLSSMQVYLVLLMLSLPWASSSSSSFICFTAKAFQPVSLPPKVMYLSTDQREIYEKFYILISITCSWEGDARSKMPKAYIWIALYETLPHSYHS